MRLSELGSYVPSPEYVAVIVCVPAASADVVMVALPPLRATVPSVVVPSVKVTLPVSGAVPEPGLTVAVKVTVWPTFDELSEDLTLVVLFRRLTVCVRVAVLAPWLESPE